MNFGTMLGPSYLALVLFLLLLFLLLLLLCRFIQLMYILLLAVELESDCQPSPPTRYSTSLAHIMAKPATTVTTVPCLPPQRTVIPRASTLLFVALLLSLLFSLLLLAIAPLPLPPPPPPPMALLEPLFACCRFGSCDVCATTDLIL
jgi:hypothetical protein